MQIVLIVIAVAFGFLCVAGIVGSLVWVYIDSRKRQRLTLECMANLAGSLVEVAKRLDELVKIPGYMDGLVKVCGDHVIQVAEMKELVNSFRLSLFGPNKSKEAEDRGAFQPYDDTKAQESYEIQEMVDAGFSPGEARDRVKGAKSGHFTLG